ncbi:hypothetical protein ACLIJR_18315 [Hydrogenophaga sp. XSHU_21]
MTAYINSEAAQTAENTPQFSTCDDPASVKEMRSRSTPAAAREAAPQTPPSQSTISLLEDGEGQVRDGPVTVEDHSTDSSMELAIGSSFECRTRLSEGRIAEVDMDARALFKSSVVQLMEGIQNASSKVINRMRSRTKLSVRVKAVSESEARLWAVLNMRELSESERKQMREFAAGVTSEMYAPTTPKMIEEFQSRIASIEQAHASGNDADAAYPEAADTAIQAKRLAFEKAAEDLLPSHMQRVVFSCGAEADAKVIGAAIQRVVEKGRSLGDEFSKSKEWKGLELRFCNEPLLQRGDLPQARAVTEQPDELPLQDAEVTKIDFVKCIVSLHLSRDQCRADVEYNDQEHGDTIGEWLITAYRANRKLANPDGKGVQHPRLRVGLTRWTAAAGKRTYALSSIEVI